MVDETHCNVPLHAHISALFSDLIARYRAAGFSTPEIISAMQTVLDHEERMHLERREYEEEAAFPEPANDWSR